MVQIEDASRINHHPVIILTVHLLCAHVTVVYPRLDIFLLYNEVIYAQFHPTKDLIVLPLQHTHTYTHIHFRSIRFSSWTTCNAANDPFSCVRVLTKPSSPRPTLNSIVPPSRRQRAIVAHCLLIMAQLQVSLCECVRTGTECRPNENNRHIIPGITMGSVSIDMAIQLL